MEEWYGLGDFGLVQCGRAEQRYEKVDDQRSAFVTRTARSTRQYPLRTLQLTLVLG